MSDTKKTGYVHSLESFGLVDGPGVRFVVFLQGCALRCKFCHNPETWHSGGTEWNAEDLVAKLLRYRPYWRDNGGVTFSGGEPLLQMDFVTEVFTRLKKEGVHTCIDTAGQPFRPDDPEWLARFDKLMAVTDLTMLDLKEFDEQKHIELTGRTNTNILAMARYLSEHGHDMWIRHVLVPGVTDDEEGLRQMSDFIASLKHVKRVEILPYHTLGLFKWKNLGIDYPLEGVPTPTDEEVKKAEALLHVTDYHD